MSTNVTDKAKEYLSSGRVKVELVTDSVAVVKVEGSSHVPYTVTFTGVWSCSCPATVECTHLVAAKLIVPLRPKPQVNFNPKFVVNLDQLVTE